MKNKTIAFLSALVLCISAFVLPTTVFAASSDDTTPPTLTAKLDGETLNIEASDDASGVEAVYVDDTRVNLLVNGKAAIALKDYAGDEKQVVVYAVDYSGNRSKEVKLNNPYYKESPKPRQVLQPHLHQPAQILRRPLLPPRSLPLLHSRTITMTNLQPPRQAPHPTRMKKRKPRFPKGLSPQTVQVQFLIQPPSRKMKNNSIPLPRRLGMCFT